MTIEGTADCPDCGATWVFTYEMHDALPLCADQSCRLSFTCRTCYGTVIYEREATEPPAHLYTWVGPAVDD